MRKDNSITIQLPVQSPKTVKTGPLPQCDACKPLRQWYRESLIPIRLNDTGEIITLGSVCLRRIMTRFFMDQGLPYRVLTGPLAAIRARLIVDLALDYPASSLGIPSAELAFVRSNPKPRLRMTADDLRLYLADDIARRTYDRKSVNPSVRN